VRIKEYDVIHTNIPNLKDE